RIAPVDAAISAGSVPGSRWSECLWLARIRSTSWRSPPRRGARVIRTWGREVPSYLCVRCSERYRSTARSPVGDLNRKPLWPNHQARIDPGAGVETRISSISSVPDRRGSIIGPGPRYRISRRDAKGRRDAKKTGEEKDRDPKIHRSSSLRLCGPLRLSVKRPPSILSSAQLLPHQLHPFDHRLRLGHGDVPR